MSPAADSARRAMSGQAFEIQRLEAENKRLREALRCLTNDIASSAAVMDAVSLLTFEDALAALSAGERGDV